ncbi:superoxide dismutase family protein [Paenibacillus sp. L3-i20]|uniref:superoxide dismutase family protein n=1 Tax=Paenibacillus sp. L3-i20 TaxID=2905833 RepID=UPI001EE001CE|nr:superoxide dismutase family protein [Paenibacillus sp. L3-i20]GKU76458.1 superoxide dismutase [Cu-Zn] 1 [Paenibacillus sp. L3-i20]
MKKIIMLAVLLVTMVTMNPSLSYADSNTSEENEEAGILVPIINSKGKEIGSAKLTEQGDKVILHVVAKELPTGVHGIHFHNVGKCDTPDFKTAGDHYNPHQKQHGFNNPKGFHSGDLPNIEVGSDGTVDTSIESSNVTLQRGKPNSLLKEGGVAIIIHEKADDYVTDPSGNSGARIACAFIK